MTGCSSPPSTSGPRLTPPDTTFFPARPCEPTTALIVTVTINPDVPVPDCAIVSASERLRVVNNTNGFHQPGATITVSFADLAPRVIRRGGSATFDTPFGEYLALGEHYLKVSYYPGTNVVIWLK